MPKRAILALADGTVYVGRAFGAARTSVGELVFSTSMTGYQEALTDPSYAGQILTLTYPLIGNYGINAEDFESSRIQVEGFVVREACDTPSHVKANASISQFLKKQGIPGISGLDTRSIVRKLRNFGVMPAALGIGNVDARQLVADAKKLDYSATDFVPRVTCKELKKYDAKAEKKRVVLIDCGVKESMIRELIARRISVVRVPATSTAAEIMAHEPDGILVSNGPGDPALLEYIAKVVRELMYKRPLMGICLGHQILGVAAGAKTFKLKFGHRGANHPVKDLETGRVHITTQNHGFAVDARTLPKDFVVTHLNGNDGTVEGLRHRELPVFSVQYHPEANPGPRDNTYLFDKFAKML